MLLNNPSKQQYDQHLKLKNKIKKEKKKRGDNLILFGEDFLGSKWNKPVSRLVLKASSFRYCSETEIVPSSLTLNVSLKLNSPKMSQYCFCKPGNASMTSLCACQIYTRQFVHHSDHTCNNYTKFKHDQRRTFKDVYHVKEHHSVKFSSQTDQPDTNH